MRCRRLHGKLIALLRALGAGEPDMNDFETFDAYGESLGSAGQHTNPSTHLLHPPEIAVDCGVCLVSSPSAKAE